jgi:hypothetical protein
MSEHVTPGDELWNWAVRKFAGEDTGQPVDWDSSDPAPFEARCRPARGAKRATICIRDLSDEPSLGTSERFNFLWAYAVFELHNVSQAKRYAETARQASQGNLGREAFIIAMLENERFAGEATRVFFLKKFLPIMRLKGVRVLPERFHCFTFFANPVARQEHWRSLKHWEHFGSYFDRLVEWRVFGDVNNLPDDQRNGE